jgi:hypothetical protein
MDMATDQNFSDLLKAVHAEDAGRIEGERLRNNLAAKISAANARAATATKKAQQAARPVLGLLIKSAVEDAVRAGRLCGTSAVNGLRAMGLED